MKHSLIKKILFLIFSVLIVANPAFASETNGTIVTGGNAGYAWSDQAGWMNFGCSNCGISITDSGITGYVWNNNYGWINMAPTNGGVAVATSGALSGYAWGTNLGWINFSGVSINSSGKFIGQATGTIIDTLTFDCTNCNVTTDYRPQNFRTTTPAPTPVVSSGGGAVGVMPYFNRSFLNSSTSSVISSVPPSSGGTEGGGAPNTSTTSVPASSSSTTPQVPSVFTAPSQLFDIRLLLDQEKVARANALVARVTFESFGRVPTPVDMNFSIVDKNGNSVWQSVDKTTVQTEAVFIKRFSDASLPPGAYTLRLNTRYNTNVTDTFEVPFTIASAGTQSSWVGNFLAILSVVIAMLLFFFLLKRRSDEQEGMGTFGR